MSEKENALHRLLDVLNSEPPTGEVYSMRSSQLAVLWPTLAAALADVMQAHGLPPARGLRAAALVVRADRAQNAAADVEDTRAIAGMGSCAREGCGHVQHQHGNKWPGRCQQCQCAGWLVKFERTEL
jgi:hypothetical protein